MKTRSLRIPLILTWTALSSGAVLASGACSSSSEPSTSDAAAKDGTASDATKEDRVAMEASPSDAPDATEEAEAAVPFECEKITDSSVLFYDAAGLMNCPDGEMKVPIV
jgi:hypothetical protein